MMTRTDRRRFPVLLAVIAALALAMAMPFSMVHAQSVSEGVDDCPRNTTTTCEVEVGGSVMGTIGNDLDTDWFRVELKAGRTYRIDMKGAILVAPDTLLDRELTLRLPQINTIRGRNGGQLVNTFGRDESSAHHLFRVTFHAHDDGAHYIAASGESFERGGYKLRVIDITPDDDATPVAVTVRFGAASYTATEGGTAATVTVNLSADPERSVTIPVTAAGANGAGSGDYTLSETSVTIDSGETSATFIVTATDDSVDDDGESVNLSFGTLPDGVSRGAQATATVSLVDNDGATAPSVSSATVSQDGTTIDIVFDEDLDRSGTAPAASAFEVAVDGGTAVNPDSVAFHGTDADTITLTMATADAIGAGETVSVDYTKPTANPLKDAADNEVASFTGQAASNRLGAPAEVRAYAGNGRVDVEWDAPASGDAPSGYQVQWKAPSDTAYDDTRSATVVAGVAEYGITGLTNGDTYMVQVRALDDSNNLVNDAAQSPEVTVGRPKMVSNLAAAGRDEDFRVDWDAPDERGEGFATDGNGDPVLVYRISWNLIGGDARVRCVSATAANRFKDGSSNPDNGGSYKIVVEARFETIPAVDPAVTACADQTGFGPEFDPPAYVTVNSADPGDEDDAALVAGLEAAVAALEDQQPWMRTAWDHLEDSPDTSVLAADHPRDGPGFSHSYECSLSTTTFETDALDRCYSIRFHVDIDWDLMPDDEFEYLLARELGRAWFYNTDVHTTAQPRSAVGRALLYFSTQDFKDGDSKHVQCTFDAMADAIAHVAVGTPAAALDAYGATCFTDDRAEPAALTEAVVRHALHPSGAGPGGGDTESSWFTDTYATGAEAWTAVESITPRTQGTEGAPLFPHSRSMVVTLLQDEFGGYCSPLVANGAAFGTGSFENVGDDNDVTDPWNTFGCEPGAPTGVSVTAVSAAGIMTVTWTAPTKGGAPVTGYTVQWRTDMQTWAQAAAASQSKDVGATPPELQLSVSASEQYKVRVRASNSIGDGPWSADASAADSTSPAVDSATVAPDGATIDIVFDEDLDRTGSEPAASAFDVTVDGGTAVNPASVDFDDDFGNEDTIELTMATANTIAAGATVTVAYDKPTSNALADTANNEVADFTQTATNRPAAPVVTLTAGDGKLTAAWSAPANGGSAITGYDVEWKTASQTWAEAGTAGQSATPAADATDHEITGLTNGIEYTVRARAGNDAWDGPWSAEASETPIAGDTTAPEVSSATVSSDGATIDIVFDEDLDATGSAPAAASFTVTVGTATGVSPASVAFHATEADTITLTMAATDTVAAGAAVTVAYDQPTSNALADAASNEVESFTGNDAIAALNRPAAPGKPQNIQIVFEETTNGYDAKLSWDAPDDLGGGTFQSYSWLLTKSTDGGNLVIESDDMQETAPAADSPIRERLSSPEIGDVYRLAVTVWTEAASASAARSAIFVLGETGAPEVTQAAMRSDGLLLAWSAPEIASSLDVTGYQARYKLTGAADVDDSWTTVAAGATSPYTITGLADSAGYNVRMRAVIEWNSGDYYGDWSEAKRADNPWIVAGGVEVTSLPESKLGGVTFYGRGETLEFTVEFNEEVTVTGEPEFEFCLGAVDASCTEGEDPPARRRAAYSSGDGTDKLVFSYVVGLDATDLDTDGIRIGDSAIRLGDDEKIVSADTETAAYLGHPALGIQTGHRVDDSNVADTTAPSVSSAKVSEDGMTIVIVFDQELDSSSTVETGEFAVTVGAALPRKPLGAALNGADTVTLTIHDPLTLTPTTAIAAGETVSVAYTAPATGGLQDDSSNKVANFTESVINRPAKPTGLTLTAGHEKLTASWTAPTATGGSAITRYDVEWKTAAQTWKEAATAGQSATAAADAATHEITGLTNDTEYTVRVRAVNGAGNGPWSAEASETPAVPANKNADLADLSKLRASPWRALTRTPSPTRSWSSSRAQALSPSRLLR